MKQEYLYIFISLFTIHCFGQIQKEIDTIDYVTYKKDNWKNKEDLSFCYELFIKENYLNLKMHVHDEKVFLKNNNSIVSDHVELWLFDPEILTSLQNDKQKLHKFISSRKSQFPDPVTAKNDNERRRLQYDWQKNQEIIQLARNQMKAIDRFQFSNQFIFNLKSILTFPEFMVDHNIQYTYKKNKTGYSFECKIPVFNSITFKNDTLNELGYLIGVSDIDNPNSKHQEKLMSTSSKAKFNEPNTFNTLDCKLVFNLPDSLAFYNQFNISGIFKLTAHGYAYYVGKTVPFSGNYGFDRGLLPGGFEPISINTIYHQLNTKIGYYFYKLILNVNNKSCILDLKDHLNCANVFKIDLYDYQETDHMHYLLISVLGPTKWPQGMGWCGAGYENELLYLQLDKDCKLIKSETIAYQSCAYSRAINKIDINEENIIVEYHDYQKKSDFSIVYAFNQPSEGFRRTELK